MTWTKRCMVVPDSQRVYAQQLAFAVAGASAANMWASGGCSPTGIAPPTLWVNEGRVQDQFSGLLPFSSVTGSPGNWIVTPVSGGDAATVFAVATANGFPTTLAAVQALFAVIDITDQNPFDAMQRLSVQQIPGPK